MPLLRDRARYQGRLLTQRPEHDAKPLYFYVHGGVHMSRLTSARIRRLKMNSIWPHAPYQTIQQAIQRKFPRIVVVPSLDPADYPTPEHFISAFYQAIGWDPHTQRLNPIKIKVNPETWKRISKALSAQHGEEGAFLWLKHGPSSYQAENVREFMVHILPGALVPQKKGAANRESSRANE